MRTQNDETSDNRGACPVLGWCICSVAGALAITLALFLWQLVGKTVGTGFWGISHWWNILAPALIFAGLAHVFTFTEKHDGTLSPLAVDMLGTVAVLVGLVGGIISTFLYGIAGAVFLVAAMYLFFGLIVLLDSFRSRSRFL